MRGTVTATFELEPDLMEAAIAALLNVAFDARRGGDEGTVIAQKHYGTDNPDGETQRRHVELAQKALADAGLQAVLRSTGVAVSGGTRRHRWLEVYLSDLEPLLLGGEPIRVLAADDEEATRALDALAERLSVPRDKLTVKPKSGWGGYE